ncbi:MAG TPA: type I-U CRISPR-associated protein Cas8c [Rhizomicrobium sp.]|nr:type I-U CRISPR-associated protein Cas8c [Rhizomicrobium sp.]
MAEASIPVDLLNPGQVFACLGFMEAAEILCGRCEGGFNYKETESLVDFVLRVDGARDPVMETLRFLRCADVQAIAPRGSDLSTTKWQVETVARQDAVFPGAIPDSPAALPMLLRTAEHSIPIEHWADGSDRDNVKFWAGAAGYPGAALGRDALNLIRDLGDNALAAAAANPFNVSALQSSSFRFDWRRDYIPLDAGFSPNEHGGIEMVGYPFVELLAAIGMQNARPARVEARNKLAYRYGVSNAMLRTVFARAILGGESLGFPIRLFRMRLGWPGQEGQARCIIDAQEELTT